MDEDEEEANEQVCPFCGSANSCPHLLLFVDKTYRTAMGGVLMDAFNQRWSIVCKQHENNADFTEREPFNALLDEVDSMADAMDEGVHERGPGSSSTYSTFFSSSAAKANAAKKKFQS